MQDTQLRLEITEDPEVREQEWPSQVMERKGWIRGYFSNTHGVCVLGAAREAFGGPRDPRYKRFYRYFYGLHGSPAAFNDDMWVNKKQVIRACRVVEQKMLKALTK